MAPSKRIKCMIGVWIPTICVSRCSGAMTWNLSINEHLPWAFETKTGSNKQMHTKWTSSNSLFSSAGWIFNPLLVHNDNNNTNSSPPRQILHWLTIWVCFWDVTRWRNFAQFTITIVVQFRYQQKRMYTNKQLELFSITNLITGLVYVLRIFLQKIEHIRSFSEYGQWELFEQILYHVTNQTISTDSIQK